MLPVIDSCDGCGGCCRGRIVPPFEGVDDPEFTALPTLLQQQLRSGFAHSAGRSEDSACAWLDITIRRCRHYELRPKACRDFERGSLHCHMLHRKWFLPLEGVPS